MIRTLGRMIRRRIKKREMANKIKVIQSAQESGIVHQLHLNRLSCQSAKWAL